MNNRLQGKKVYIQIWPPIDLVCDFNIQHEHFVVFPDHFVMEQYKALFLLLLLLWFFIFFINNGIWWAKKLQDLDGTVLFPHNWKYDDIV